MCLRGRALDGRSTLQQLGYVLYGTGSLVLVVHHLLGHMSNISNNSNTNPNPTTTSYYSTY